MTHDSHMMTYLYQDNVVSFYHKMTTNTFETCCLKLLKSYIVFSGWIEYLAHLLHVLYCIRGPDKVDDDQISRYFVYII